jgi:glycosyltransferase involved in cell wall biosynthesis
MSQHDLTPQLSVIVPVGERYADLREIYCEYKTGLTALSMTWEMIFVLDGPHAECEAALNQLAACGEPITVVGLTRAFGESTALMAGFEQSSAEFIATLPAYHQIDGNEIDKLVAGLSSADLCVGRRWPRQETWSSSMRRVAFHRLAAWVTGMPLRDLGCGARVMRRRVLEEIALYGDQHRFLALLADRQGFRVREIDLRQSPKDHFTGGYRAREYAHRVLDIFTVFFLVRFTKKPLRFFGMVGVSTFVIGLILILIMTGQRLFFHQPLADRPALLLSSLLIVLGLQVFALGLLGELIIFTHAKDLKDYQVDRIIEFETLTTPVGLVKVLHSLPDQNLPPSRQGDG